MMEELCGEGFVRMPGAVSPVGVYCLLRKGKVVYVGQSRAIYARLGKHLAIAKRGRGYVPIHAMDITASVSMKYDEVVVRFCAAHELDRLEMEYIERFDPEYNIRIRRRVPDLPIDLLALAKRAGLEDIFPIKRRHVA